MGLCCCKFKNEDSLERRASNRPRTTTSTIVTSVPSPSARRSSPSNSKNLVSTHRAFPQGKRVNATKTQVTRQSFEPFNKDKNAAETLNEIHTTKCKISVRNDPIEENAAQAIFSTNYKIKLRNYPIQESEVNPVPTSLPKISLLFPPKKITSNIDMVREIMQCMYLPQVRFIPIRQTYKELNLDPESKDYQYAKLYFRNKKFNDAYEIKQIRRVWNPYLYIQYQIMKDKCKDHSKTRILYHGTQLEHLESILSNNFDWRKIKAGKFGWGVSFANNPYYASHYSAKHHEGDKYHVMILVRVLVGQTSLGTPFTRIPALGDTTSNRDGQVLVKFDDASYYPEFIIYFEPRTRNILDLGSLSLSETSNNNSKIEIDESNGMAFINSTKEVNNDITTLLKSTQLQLTEPVPTTPINPRSLIPVEESTTSTRVVQSVRPIRQINSVRPTRSLVPKKPLGSIRQAGSSRPIYPHPPRSSIRPVGFVRPRPPRVPRFTDKVFAPRGYPPFKYQGF